MRFKEIDPGRKVGVNPTDNAKISEECSDIIEIYSRTGRIFYRGVDSINDNVIYGVPHTDRKPLYGVEGTKELFHDVMNDSLENRGLVRRDQATFVTSSRASAGTYGAYIYMIFPVNGFKYTWNPAYKDFILDDSIYQNIIDQKKLKKAFIDKMTTGMARNNLSDEERKETVSALNDFEPITGPVEYMRYIKKFPESIRYQNPGWRNYLDDKAIGRIMAAATDTEIEEALKSENEVWFSGPYYGIEATEKNIMDVKKKMGLL